ncbi:MAG: PAS domain-containing protein, partial [Thermodesulfobacteriota bacterium]
MKFSQGKNLKTAEKAVIVVILILAATIIFVVFAYYGQKEFRKTITFQTEQHLLTIARINAGRLQDLVSDLSGQLKIIAEEGAVQDEILKRSDFSVLHDYPIRIFYKSHQDVVDAFTALDCQGSVLYRQSFCKDNRGGRVGNDLTDKPGVAYVVEEHEPYTSEVFVNNSGQPAISISEPVFHKNEFIGIVRWMINLKNFTNRFIKPIQNSGEEKNSIYVIDRNGKILIHSDQEYIGHHVIPYNYDKSPDHCCSDLENIIGKMIKGREGTGSYYAPIHGAEGLSSGEKLIAYCPVRFLDNRLWSIGVSMNYERIAGPIYSHAVEHVSVTGLVMILLIAGGFIFYWMEKRKSEEFEKSNRELTKEAAERLKAEEALIRSETQKQAILDASVDMIMLVDRNMRIIWANKMAGLVVNKKPDDLIGHTCHKFFQNLDEPCPGCPCKKPFETGRIESAIMYQPAMDTVGESYWEDYGVPVKDETGKVTGVIEIARNVTEKVKTEKAVRESEQKFAGIVESVVDAMFMIDEQFNIVWTNDIAKDLFGEDMIGRKCHSVLHGDESICSQCLAKHCFQDGGVHDFETSITVRDHGWRTFWCTVSVASRHEDGRPKKVVESLRDITDRKNAKREIETLKRQIEFILGATKTGLDIIDSEFNIRYIDPEWRKVYGDPAGRKCYEYFMDRTEMCHDCKIPQALETKKVQTSEHLLIKEGRRPVLVSTLPFQNEEGDWLVAEVN